MILCVTKLYLKFNDLQLIFMTQGTLLIEQSLRRKEMFILKLQ